MGGVATDYGLFIKTLMNSENLRNLMLIPTAEQTNSQMIDKYFVESVTSGVITTTPICRVILTSNPQLSTNNMYVKQDMLAIEVFVPNSSTTAMKDRMPGFERRSNQIVDEIIRLLNNKLINGRRLRLEARHELASGTPGFCRHYICFSYKRLYS